MRRSLSLLTLTVLLAACGGQTQAGSVPKAKGAPDPARALAALIDAAHRGDASAVSALLVDGPKANPSELGKGLATFAGKKPHTLYRGGGWAVAVVSGRRTAGAHQRTAYAVALHLVDGRWRADLTKRTTVRILGPRPGVRTAVVPQVAAALESHAPLAESGLWLDGRELIEKGGGSPTRGTVYGAPEHPLAPGVHVAVAYARDAKHGAAVAWVFRV